MVPKILLKFTRIRLVVLITITAILLSLLITYAITVVFSNGFDPITLSSAIVVPLLISPALTWYIVGLMLKIQILEQEQRHLASFDVLTGLYSRRAFLEQVDELIDGVSSERSYVSFAYIDLDNFKKINSHYGHSGGDEALKQFGLILKSITGENDVSGRIGGEEFGLAIWHHANHSVQEQLNSLLCNAQKSEVEYETNKITFTVSIGVSTFKLDDNTTSKQLINQADQALLLAKTNGKNRIEVYSA